MDQIVPFLRPRGVELSLRPSKRTFFLGGVGAFYEYHCVQMSNVSKLQLLTGICFYELHKIGQMAHSFSDIYLKLNLFYSK